MNGTTHYVNQKCMSRHLFCIPLTKFWRSISCRFACVRSWIKTSYGMWPLLSSVDVSSIQSDIARPLFCTRGWWGDGSSSDIESLCLLDPPWLFPSGMFPPYPRFRSSCWWLIPVPGMGGNLGENLSELSSWWCERNSLDAPLNVPRTQSYARVFWVTLSCSSPENYQKFGYILSVIILKFNNKVNLYCNII